MHGRVGRFVKIELYFDNKWLLISEIKFKSKSTAKDVTFNVDLDQDDLEDKAEISAGVAEHSSYGNQEPDLEVSAQDGASDKSDTKNGDDVQMSDTPHPPGSNSGLITDNTNDKSPRSPTASENNQIYIGLVIGVLGVTVLLLLVTIVIMMRRNKQKIFNKQFNFKSPLSDRHMMRDLTPLNGCGNVANGSRKLYDESELEESNSIYHEPYR